jgi:hypothetical protein
MKRKETYDDIVRLEFVPFTLEVFWDELFTVYERAV